MSVTYTFMSEVHAGGTIYAQLYAAGTFSAAVPLAEGSSGVFTGSSTPADGTYLLVYSTSSVHDPAAWVSEGIELIVSGGEVVQPGVVLAASGQPESLVLPQVTGEVDDAAASTASFEASVPGVPEGKLEERTVIWYDSGSNPDPHDGLVYRIISDEPLGGSRRRLTIEPEMASAPANNKTFRISGLMV